jgi:hypothetical protein
MGMGLSGGGLDWAGETLTVAGCGLRKFGLRPLGFCAVFEVMDDGVDGAEQA